MNTNHICYRHENNNKIKWLINIQAMIRKWMFHYETYSDDPSFH